MNLLTIIGVIGVTIYGITEMTNNITYDRNGSTPLVRIFRKAVFYLMVGLLVEMCYVLPFMLSIFLGTVL